MKKAILIKFVSKTLVALVAAMLLIEVPVLAGTPIIAVYPSGSTLAQRTMRISLHFSAPVAANVANHLQLLRNNSQPIVYPFVDPPLWSSDSRTLTLLLDPSRQKLGINNHDAMGFVLPPQGTVSLALDSAILKTWRIDHADCLPLDARSWIVSNVRIGSRDQLRVSFPGPIDIMSEPYLAVATLDNRRVAGTSALIHNERMWTFMPDSAWVKGDRIAINSYLEDPCGNELGDPFEHPAGATIAPRHTRFLRIPMLMIAEDQSRS